MRAGIRAIRETTFSMSATLTVAVFPALKPEQGAYFIHDINGLVRQKTLVDVAVGKFSSGPDGSLGVMDMVMLLVAGLQSLEDVKGVLYRRLLNVDFLKSPGEGPVFFNLVLVFFVGRRADAAQNTRLQGRFEQVGGIHGTAAGSTRSDNAYAFHR